MIRFVVESHIKMPFALLMATLWAGSCNAGTVEFCGSLVDKISPAQSSGAIEYVEIRGQDEVGIQDLLFRKPLDATIVIGLKRNVLRLYNEYAIVMGVEALVAPEDSSFEEVVDTSWGTLSNHLGLRTVFYYEGQQNLTVREKLNFSNYASSSENDDLWVWSLNLRTSIVDSSGSKVGDGDLVFVNCPAQLPNLNK